jgi:hypothetical protein
LLKTEGYVEENFKIKPNYLEITVTIHGNVAVLSNLKSVPI